MINVINLTPHAIHIVDEHGNQIRTYFPVSPPARVYQRVERLNSLSDGTPLSKAEFGTTVGLPFTVSQNTKYIVSRMIMAANPDRKDLLVPTEIVRDKEGNIVGAKSLSIN